MILPWEGIVKPNKSKMESIGKNTTGTAGLQEGKSQEPTFLQGMIQLGVARLNDMQATGF